MTAPGIRIENLTVGYGDEAVLKDISLEMPGGKVPMIVGGSGSGKSTLLKNILQLHRPFSGTISIGENEVFGQSGKGRSCLRQGMGVLFQDGALLGSLTLQDNVALPLREHTRLSEKEIEDVVIAKLTLVGLEEAADLYPHELSGGMRKRAGLARALVMDPMVLFCDEPTSGLDPILSAELDALLLEMMDHFDMTMVVVSHDLASMETIADHVVVLGEGQLLFSGPLEELEKTEDPYLRRFLDREPEERDTPRLPESKFDRTRLKIDCNRPEGGQRQVRGNAS